MNASNVAPTQDTRARSMEGERFPFGRNWASFLTVLDESRIREAERSLAEMLGRDRIAGATFLDAGSGSGLFSLAAMRLGARRVHSFDFDPDSVGVHAGAAPAVLPGGRALDD